MTVEWIIALLFSHTKDDFNIVQHLLSKVSQGKKVFKNIKVYSRMSTWWWTNKCLWLKHFNIRSGETKFFMILSVCVYLFQIYSEHVMLCL